MRVKVGFKVGDKVTYNVRGEKIAAAILAIHNPESVANTEYEIRITTNAGRAYRKGEKFRTTGNWLSLKSRPITSEQKATRERKATERRAMATLKGMKTRMTESL